MSAPLNPVPLFKPIANVVDSGNSTRHAADGHEAGSDGVARRGDKFAVRICDVFGTPWRISRDLKLKDPGEFKLTNAFGDFYKHQKGLPQLLNQEYHEAAGQLTVDGKSDDLIADLLSVEVVLFALPIPVNQVVAAVVVDLREPEISSLADGRIKKLVDALLSNEERVQIAGRSVLEIVDDLAWRAGAEPVDSPVPDSAIRGPENADVRVTTDWVDEDEAGERVARVNGRAAKRKAAQDARVKAEALRVAEKARTKREFQILRWAMQRRAAVRGRDVDLGLAAERHLMVFAYHEDPTFSTPEDIDKTSRDLINGVHWPNDPEFATIKRPRELNGRSGDIRQYAAISHYASVLYGHSGSVNASALLIAAQTVGTAARFQLIWSRASQQVEEFQREKQQQSVGRQTRESLAPLADEMGNLELDLTFNVQTAADLGLGSTTTFVDSFQRCLHEVMKFRTRADTVAEMFQRVNSSIQSELTAIISRERREEEERRKVEAKRWERSGAVVGLLSFFGVPLAVIFGFFGVSTGDVGGKDHILDFRKFWLVYAVAGVLMIVTVISAWVLTRVPLYKPEESAETTGAIVRRPRRGRKRAGEKGSRS